jgi:hypothetical protein
LGAEFSCEVHSSLTFKTPKSKTQNVVDYDVPYGVCDVTRSKNQRNSSVSGSGIHSLDANPKGVRRTTNRFKNDKGDRSFFVSIKKQIDT